MNVYIAFDQALACSGLAIYSEASRSIIASQIQTSREKDIGTRLLDLEDYWNNIFDILNPKGVFYEYVYSGVNTPFESIKVLGILEKVIAQKELSSQCFRSSAKEKKSGKSWRGLLALGSDKKELQAKLRLDGKANHNICDAIGILGAGLLSQGIISLPNDLYQIPIEISYVREPKSLCEFI